jgi:hypothetical protein
MSILWKDQNMIEPEMYKKYIVRWQSGSGEVHMAATWYGAYWRGSMDDRLDNVTGYMEMDVWMTSDVCTL